MAFLFAEIENRLSEGLPQADFGRVPERFLLSVRTKSKLRFCKLKTTPIVRFCNNSTHFLILSPSANTLHNFFGGGLSILLFHSFIKLTFLASIVFI